MQATILRPVASKLLGLRMVLSGKHRLCKTWCENAFSPALDTGNAVSIALIALITP